MAHYAFLDEDNIVTEVIVGRNEDETVDGVSDWETYYGNIRGQVCKRTSFNNNIRKQFAGVGYTYDDVDDVFIAPAPFNSWYLDENYDWQPPVPYPNGEGMFVWDEANEDWVLSF
jgi:hypothetical protein